MTLLCLKKIIKMYELQKNNWTCGPVALRNLFLWQQCENCLKEWSLEKLIALTKCNRKGVDEREMVYAIHFLSQKAIYPFVRFNPLFLDPTQNLEILKKILDEFRVLRHFVLLFAR
jgi:hypothetical protein